MPGNFQVTITEGGDWWLHQDGDPTKKVIARMPKDGYYFDSLETTAWNPDYKPPSIESLKDANWRRLDDETLTYLQGNAFNLRKNTDKALVLTNWGNASLGPPFVGSIPDWLTILITEPTFTSIKAAYQESSENPCLRGFTAFFTSQLPLKHKNQFQLKQESI